MQANRIMVAIDFSDGSDRALGHAIALALRLDAEIDLVHVAPMPPIPPEELLSADPIDFPGFQGHRESLEAARQTCRDAGVPARIFLEVGHVTFGLLETIARLEPLFVVVGSHGKGALARALLGSVSETLSRRASVPVLVIPSPRQAWVSARVAWSCDTCGHILSAFGSSVKCSECGASPARWNSAMIEDGPADAAERAMSEGGPSEAVSGGSQPTAMFATAPGGAEGYSVNPELRIRY